MKELTQEQLIDIRILDLQEALENIKQSDEKNIWYRELTAIKNAINLLKSIKSYEQKAIKDTN